jgi:hypothetical protein
VKTKNFERQYFPEEPLIHLNPNRPSQRTQVKQMIFGFYPLSTNGARDITGLKEHPSRKF